MLILALEYEIERKRRRSQTTQRRQVEEECIKVGLINKQSTLI